MLAASAIAAVLLAVPAAAGACPNLAKVKSIRGSVHVDFTHTVSDGNHTVTLSHNTTVIHFASLTPRYTRVGPPGHKKKVLYQFKASKAKSGAVLVDDSYSDSSGNHGTQTAHGPPQIARITIGTYSPIGCASAHYAWVAGFTIATKSSGTWPTPFDRGVEIDVGSPTRATPGNLDLSGSAKVKWSSSGSQTGAGFFGTHGPFGSGSQYEDEFGGILSRTGQSSNGIAHIHWSFEPN